MAQIKDLRQMVDDYIVFSLELRKKTSDLRSLFGPRTEEIEHPGHQEFDQAVENWTKEFAAAGPSGEALNAALEVLLFSAREQEGRAPFWYLTAIQRHSMLLLPMLEDGAREALAARFAAAYPPKRQVPSQAQIHRMLDPAAGSRRSLFGRKK